MEKKYILESNGFYYWKMTKTKVHVTYDKDKAKKFNSNTRATTFLAYLSLHTWVRFKVIEYTKK